jgi:hypothetical protein
MKAREKTASMNITWFEYVSNCQFCDLPNSLGNDSFGITAQAVIKHFKALLLKERAAVAKYVVESDDSWIPESFKRGMADADAGRFVGMEMILNDAPPSFPAAEEMKYRFKPTDAFGESFYSLTTLICKCRHAGQYGRS